MHEPAISPFFVTCYLILAAIGIPANLLAIVVLSMERCGLSRCITYYLVAIAVSDFLVNITVVIINRIGGIYFRASVLSTTALCRLNNVLVFSTRDSSVWLTVAFTIDRSVAICCHSMKSRYCTEKTALIAIGIVCLLSCIKNLPFYFIYQPLYIVDGVSWFCDIRSTFYTSFAWQAYHWLDRIFTPFLPFILIMLLNVLTVKHITAASQARRRLRGDNNHEDREMSNRKRSIVLLFSISLSFLLLWATYVGHFLYVRIRGEAYFSGLNFNDLQYILSEMTNMFIVLSSCNNVFIYAATQKRFRTEVMNLLLCPIVTIFASFKCEK